MSDPSGCVAVFVEYAIRYSPSSRMSFVTRYSVVSMTYALPFTSRLMSSTLRTAR